MFIKHPLLKKILLPLKIIITIALTTYILLKVDWSKVTIAIENADKLLIAVVFVIMILTIFLSTAKWQALLRIHNIQFSFGQLFRYYSTAMFFNNFLPTSIGGDGYRLYKTVKNPRSKSGAVIAVIAERLTGVAALLILGFIGSIFSLLTSKDKISNDIMNWGLYSLGALITVLILLYFKSRFVKDLIKKIIPDKFKNVFNHIYDYQHNYKLSLRVIFISFIFQFSVIFNRVILINSLGSEISIYNMAVVVMVGTLIALLPITINGIGLSDGAYIFLLNNYGIDFEHAALLMILVRMMNLLIGLIGIVYYFKDKEQIPKNELSVIKSV